ncbi:hypothetical protein EMGBS4_08610 [Acidimicrobiaceae bacterium]|nr:hypothetical protein EMGBS4_08610 [Acidimicrobiaceae bacterium]
MPKIYATEGYKVFPVYFVAGLLIMLIAHRLRTNKPGQWLLDFAILSAFFTVFSDFGISSSLWFLWIALVCFVTLRQSQISRFLM